MRLISFHLRGERAIIADLSSARNACSRAPWIRKLGYLCIQEILVLTKSFVRTSVRLSLHVSGCEMSHVLDWQRHVKATKEGTVYKNASDNFCVKIKFPMISVEDRKGPVLRINGG